MIVSFDCYDIALLLRAPVVGVNEFASLQIGNSGPSHGETSRRPVSLQARCGDE
jgi:hypothetical protein